jgi:hypothetical protein
VTENRELNQEKTRWDDPERGKGCAVEEEDVRINKKTRLALAIARGESIAAWAQRNGVPRSSAFRWAKDPKIRAAIADCRRRCLNRAIGRMVSLAKKAADGITELAEGAESESLRLRAWRAILADQMAISKFSELEHRMAEIEEQLGARTGRQRSVTTKFEGSGFPSERG